MEGVWKEHRQIVKGTVYAKVFVCYLLVHEFLKGSGVVPAGSKAMEPPNTYQESIVNQTHLMILTDSNC